MKGTLKSAWFWLMLIGVSLIIATIFCYEFLGGASDYVSYDSTPLWIWWVGWTGLIFFLMSFVAFCFWISRYYRMQKCEALLSCQQGEEKIALMNDDGCTKNSSCVKQDEVCEEILCDKLLDSIKEEHKEHKHKHKEKKCAKEPAKRPCQASPRIVRISI